jgi:oligoendopeptidase F
MSRLPTRAEIEDRYKWDLSTVFESAEAWERERRAVEDRLADLRAYEGEIVSDGETLVRALRLFEEVLRRTQRLRLYARLRRNEDTTDGARRERLHESDRLDREVTKLTDALRREIAAAGRESVSGVVETTDGLGRYEGFLEDVLRMSAHARSPEVEDLLAEFADVAESPVRVYSSLTNNDVDPEPVESPTGEPVEVTGINLGTHLRHRDRAFRARAYRSVYGAYASVEHAIATAYAEKARARTTLAEARNYDSVREMAFNKPSYPETGLRIHLPVEVHDAMTAAVRGSLGPLHRYYERRRELLGLEELRPWDLDVPLVEAAAPTVPYEEAREHILAAVEPLGTAYRDRLAELFEGRRIDVYETRNKEGILAYGPWAYDTGAYVLLNYRADVRSMSILAHELGHAMHAEHLRDARSVLYATAPRPIEEVPSYVHEVLLARHLLESEDRALRRYARDRLLDLSSSIYGSTLHSLFTHRSYGVVEDDEELTLDRIEGIYADLLSEFRDPMVLDTWAERGWLVGSHGRLPYHFYQYVLGFVGALRTVDRLLDGSLAPEEYREFLRAGGRMRSVEAFRTLGLDVRSRDPFERACSAIGDHVERIDAGGATD